MRFISLPLIGILVLASATFAAEDSPLKNLHKQHPRLFIKSDDIARLREGVKTDPIMKQWHAAIAKSAERILTQPPVEHVLIGPRLLDKSRTALNRVSTLAALYLIDGDKRLAERAKLEMLTVAAFKDWNPSHFLDVAEMTNALGIGYDWLYDYLTPEERKTIRTAIVQLGLKPGLDAFNKRIGWTRTTNNWANVCNGGLTVGLLAIADEEPQLAEELFARTTVAILPSMAAYAPDGGFPEGPGYWGYATMYTAYYLGALESALGTDMGIRQMPGFAETGFFRIQCVSPIRRTFNYADAGDGAGAVPEILYLARLFNQPAFVQHELEMVRDRPSIFDLIWYSQLPAELRDAKNAKPLPTAVMYKGVNVAFFRSAWNDPKALFVGIKGGDNRASHSHLDLGSFVLDAGGYRWAVDLGPDDYNLPAYFGNKRWTYYRLRTESHNTLTIDGENQVTAAKAPIIEFAAGKDRAEQLVIDLSQAYRPKTSKVLRGLAVINRDAVLVQDEITAPQPVDVAWNLVTPAKIELENAGRSARLTQGDQILGATILSPENAKFEVISANPEPPQRQQPNMRNLRLRLPEKTSETRIVVLMQVGGTKPLTMQIEPLEDWAKTNR